MQHHKPIPERPGLGGEEDLEQSILRRPATLKPEPWPRVRPRRRAGGRTTPEQNPRCLSIIECELALRQCDGLEFPSEGRRWLGQPHRQAERRREVDSVPLDDPGPAIEQPL